MPDVKKVINGLEFIKAMITFDPSTGEDIEPEYLNEADKTSYDACVGAIALLKEQVPKILSLEEALEGKNGLEIDPCVFVEIKGREDMFIGAVNDVSHYNYPNLVFDVGECFRVDRSYSAASKSYLNTDYMKTVRFWTHMPSKEQREAMKWDA